MDLKQLIKTNIKTDWRDVLLKFETKPIDEFLSKEIKTYVPDIDIYPPEKLIFNCFNFFDINDTKVVILGQDPYINPGEAMGMCFSVPDGIKVPPSLVNIYKEINSDLKIDTSKRNGDLTRWAQQGVLLINAALTVRQGRSNSHKKPWEPYTDGIIKYLSDNGPDGIVFILWGNNARSKKKYIDSSRHYTIESSHPSPLSAHNGFFGNHHFSQTNQLLSSQGKEIIKW